MKESELLKKAQVAVVESRNLTNYEKVDILRLLLQKEELALFKEEREGEENGNGAVL